MRNSATMTADNTIQSPILQIYRDSEEKQGKGNDLFLSPPESAEPDASTISCSYVTPIFVVSVLATMLGSAGVYGYNAVVLAAPAECVISFINDSGQSQFDDSFQQRQVNLGWSLVQGAFPLGGLCGAFCYVSSLCGWKTIRHGPRSAVVLNNMLMLLASVAEVVAVYVNLFEILIVARFLVGFANGAITTTAPVYISEISPTGMRGRVGSMFQVSTIVGVVVAYLVGFYQVLGAADRWQFLFLLPAGANLCAATVLLLCPESPKYLYSIEGDWSGCSKSLQWLRGTVFVDREINDIEREHHALRSLTVPSLPDFAAPELRRPLLISVVVMLAAQLTGVSAINSYLTSIFDGFLNGAEENSPAYACSSKQSAMKLTIYFGLAQLMATVVCTALVERLGRRVLLLGGLSGMAGGLLLVSVSEAFFGTSEDSYIVSIVGLMLFLLSFNVGPAVMPWFIVTELFTTGPRMKAVSIATGVNWTCFSAVVLLFPPMDAALGGYLFFVYLAVTLACTAFLALKLPETGNASPTQISRIFSDASD